MKRGKVEVTQEETFADIQIDWTGPEEDRKRWIWHRTMTIKNRRDTVEIKQAEAAIEAIFICDGRFGRAGEDRKGDQQDTETTRKIIGHMMDGYRKKDRGIQIMELDGTYQLCTKQELYPYLIRVARQPKKLA